MVFPEGFRNMVISGGLRAMVALESLRVIIFRRFNYTY